MADVVIFHNPNCSTSKYAVSLAADLGVDVEERRYLLKAQRPTREEFEVLVGQVEDPATDLVRRDSLWQKLGLTDADASTPEQVIELLVRHKQLLQRPVVVTAERAIVGRPKERVRELLGG